MLTKVMCPKIQYCGYQQYWMCKECTLHGTLLWKRSARFVYGAKFSLLSLIQNANKNGAFLTRAAAVTITWFAQNDLLVVVLKKLIATGFIEFSVQIGFLKEFSGNYSSYANERYVYAFLQRKCVRGMSVRMLRHSTVIININVRY